MGLPVWVNTLFAGFVAGLGGDPEARRDPAAVWGRLADMGVRLIQTDAVEALLRYRALRGRRGRRNQKLHTASDPSRVRASPLAVISSFHATPPTRPA